MGDDGNAGHGSKHREWPKLYRFEQIGVHEAFHAAAIVVGEFSV